LELEKQAIAINPDAVNAYDNLANDYMALGRFTEARQTIATALARGLDDYVLHLTLYSLAFLSKDAKALSQEQSWFSARPDAEPYGLALTARTEAYEGRLRLARTTGRRAIDAALHVDSKESAALWQASDAIRDAAYGDSAVARREADSALQLAPGNQAVEIQAALAFARIGDVSRRISTSAFHSIPTFKRIGCPPLRRNARSRAKIVLQHWTRCKKQIPWNTVASHLSSTFPACTPHTRAARRTC
jgi:tetratricopeptide (TPR) repeat protein